MTALPVLDLTAFRTDPSSPAAGAFVDALREICHEVSFFHLAGHGIAPELEADVVAQALAFFDLPEADRLSVENVNSPAFRGYTRTGGEYTAGRPDRRDQLDIGPEDPEPELAEGPRPFAGLDRHSVDSAEAERHDDSLGCHRLRP